jgi:DNA-binding PucR family transcriptional regulator
MLPHMTQARPEQPSRQTVSSATRRRLEQESGALAAISVAAMTERLPWFRRLNADQRAGVLLVTQNGVTNFVAWLGSPDETIRLTAEAFRNAPRDLARRISLRHTVELVRVAIEAFERELPTHAVTEQERQILTEGILRFGREIAFAAASVYASAAETRGAWDARLEALVVDGVVRGEVDDALVSRASALGWDAELSVTVLVGSPPPEPRPGAESEPLAAVRRTATRLGRSVLLGVQGARLVVLLSGAPERPVHDPNEVSAGERLAEAFGPGPVVIGPTVPALTSAHHSAHEAMQGLRAVAGWADAPRPVAASELLPERAIAGDRYARIQLIDQVVTPLAESSGELTVTLTSYLDGGGALEACARALFVHANTVRYRLRRVTEITGYDPTDARSALVLRIALIIGRLDGSDPPPSPR